MQQAILAFMRRQALSQRTPQREHWRLEQLVLNICRRDDNGKVRLFSSRQYADARKQLRRACDRLAATGLVVKAGVGWTLPRETEEEAKVRRKRLHISKEREDREELERASQSWLDEKVWRMAPIDRPTRAKLVKVLGRLGSDNDNEVMVAARQAERLRQEIGVRWDELLAG